MKKQKKVIRCRTENYRMQNTKEEEKSKSDVGLEILEYKNKKKKKKSEMLDRKF